jgi:hypothetical protein
MNKELAETYMVEWSESQGCFHCETCSTRMRDSRRQYIQGHARGDWICLGIFPSHDEAHKWICLMEIYRKQHDNQRSIPLN